jgi:protein-tyrosine-phosphatase
MRWSPRVVATPARSCPDAYEEWVLPDPTGQSLEAVRPIRDEIEQRVRALLDELGVQTKREG